MRFTTQTPEETLDLGQKIGRKLIPGDLLLLSGDLGTGKTTLVQGISLGLGVGPEQYVRSPSFTLINQYQGNLPVYHIDLYRIESGPDLVNLGLEEYLFGEGVALVEWAERLFLPLEDGTQLFENFDYIEISIEFAPDRGRLFEISLRNMSHKTHPLFTLH
jgi:tRNA threonylcarbamoyladenosine biosynthesis protein TsaE